MAACATEPAAIEETPPPAQELAAPAEDTVWTLLNRGEGDRARAFFLGQVHVNDTDSSGRTPLHYAAENKDPVLAAFFISMGAEIDAVDGYNRTPLAISAEKLDPKTAKLLSEKNANIHYPMKGESSPARAAVRENGEFLSALLNPAALERVDSGGRTLLHIAAEEGSAGAVDTILKAENDLNRRDNDGKTPLDIALERTESRNHAEAAERLILAGAVSPKPLYGYFAPAARTSNYNIRIADGMAPLHYMAREGYTGYLAYLLEKDADVNIKNASGATPLHEAARAGNVRVIEALLDSGADANIQDAQGNSVLHIAAPPETRLQSIELFLSRGVNPNLRDGHGDSPLHVAIILNSSVDIIEALLKGQSDVTIRDINGKTPLYLAVERERNQYIPLLLAYKSDVFAADNGGVTLYERALRENASALFALITDETVFATDGAGNTMLHITVAAGGNGQAMNVILDRGASINARNKAGDTSLIIAARQNSREAGELLLSRNADIFAENAAGESPLSLTFPMPGNGIDALREWMLTSETIAAKDGLGNTALHCLAQWRYDEWIPVLINMGADTEAVNATGETPLFLAVKRDSPSTIYALISNGAQLSARDKLGNSALHAAVRWNALQGAETLIDLELDINGHALNGKTPLHDSIRLGMIDMENLLIRRGADIEARDAEGNTPFMEAVIAGNPAIMQQLVRMGTDPNTRNFRGDTPLHMSAALGRTDIATLLLEWGASIHARNAQGRTPYQDALVSSPRLIPAFLSKDRLSSSDDNGSSPLHIAVQERASALIVSAILELGAKPSSVDSEGRTPLRLAVDADLWEAAKTLADSGSDVFIVARDGKSPAELSLQKGETAVKALFSGPALNARDASENTILHYAAKQGNAYTISALLALGANANVKNIAAESPADIAHRWKHPEAEALLR